MNRYGRLAQEHWAKWRPNELSQIPDPEAFFSTLGQDVATQVQALAAALAGDDPGGEQGLQKQGRLEMARFNAEAQILREMVLLPPQPGHPDAEDPEYPDYPEDSEYPEDSGRIRDEDGELMPAGVIGVTKWMPMVMTPDHPNYHDLDDDPFLHRVTPEELRDQARPTD